MSNTARKARKRSGTPFTKAPKVGTPIEKRAYFTGDVMTPFRLAKQSRLTDVTHPRSAKKRARWLKDREVLGG